MQIGAHVQPLRKHTATVLWLHGLGDSGKGWESLGKELNTALPHVRWVFPSASPQPVSLNAGMSMPAWFDLHGLSPDSEEDGNGIRHTLSQLETLVHSEMQLGVPSNRMVVAGFSQGGATALSFALRSNMNIAGCVALSSWLPLRNEYPDKLGSAFKSGVPIFQGHGLDDPVVPFQFGSITWCVPLPIYSPLPFFLLSLFGTALVRLHFKCVHGGIHEATMMRFPLLYLQHQIAGAWGLD